MKKRAVSVLAGVLSAAFIFNVSATEIKVADSATDLISVTGDAEANNKAVSLVVLNPGYTESDISAEEYADQTDVIQYFSVAYPKSGKYAFDVAMRNTTAADVGGGAYRFIVTVGDERVHDSDYLFYFNDVKLSIIEKLNDGRIDSATVADAFYKFGLSETPLYKGGNLTSITGALQTMRDAIETNKFELNVNKFDVILRQAALLSAYNTSATALVTENGALIYPDLMEVEGTQSWSDYTTKLSASGIASLNGVLIGGEYSSIDELSGKFKEFVAYYGIIAHKDGGFDHIDTFFTNYADVYSKYGFKMNLVTDDNKNEIYNELIDTKTSNIKELATKFNSIAKSYNGDGSSSSSSSNRKGGTGGGFSGIGSMGTVVPTDSYITPEIGFDDLGSAQWASEAIMALAERGVVTGKAKRAFAPDDYVTRAEFLKMLVCALDISNSQTECAFTDVNGHWGKQYIISAVEAGITNGVNETSFEPEGIIKREMGAVFLNRALAHKGIELARDDFAFADDGALSDYAKDSVYKLKLAGILNGVGENVFDGQAYVTRAQAAKMVYEVMIYCEGEATK